MTEIVQLWIDLSTIQDAAKIAIKLGFHELSGKYDVVENALKERIANLEAQQAHVLGHNREKLAQLDTILYAIPLSCGETRELVERRIQEVKEKMQKNGN